MIEYINELDGSMLLWIQEHIRNENLDGIVTFITHLGDAGILWIVLALLFLLFKKTRRAGGCTLAALVVSFLFNNVFLKNVVARQRPYEVVEGLTRIIEAQADYSFPSGHTANSVVAATVIFLMLPKKYSFLAPVLAFLISLSRLYVGVHYPTDVLTGMLSGILIGCIVVWGTKRMMQQKNS